MKKVIRLTSIFVMVLSLVLLCSCAPKDLDAAKKKMEGKGYKVAVETISGAVSALGGSGSVKGTVTFSHEEKEISGIAMLFESASAARDYYKKNESDIKKSLDDGQVCKRVGKWLVSGDKKAVNAFL